jgi:hypothetical protein
MQTEKKKNHVILLMTAILLTIVIGLSSCTKKILFLTSAVVPAAEGSVTVKNDKNNNYNVQLTISNLASIERIQPPSNSYVVWIESDIGNARNVGKVVSSNNLNVSFETLSSFRPTKVFITAEENEQAQYPGSTIVLTTARF